MVAISHLRIYKNHPYRIDWNTRFYLLRYDERKRIIREYYNSEKQILCQPYIEDEQLRDILSKELFPEF